MSAFHAMSASIAGLFAIIVAKSVQWWDMPETITLTPESIILGLLLLLVGFVGVQAL
ncbi:MAG: hypothetical protein SV186_06950 [Candidatus Nanohaloarchaea archaeon]|nr:hypothetical protein [Candidatus Nanohaloarchaea archaeon]